LNLYREEPIPKRCTLDAGSDGQIDARNGSIG
jgi:hypothetical protein